MMKIFNIFCVCLVSTVQCQIIDLSNLGATIEKSVRASLAPLDDLGSRIRSQMAPLNNLGEQIEHQVRSSLGPMQTNLDSLGDQINREVQQSLLPVKAMAMRLEMMNGVGGKTVVKFNDGKVLIAKNGNLYECTGSITQEGDCQGNLVPLDLNKTENYCYLSPNVRVNNYMCLSNGNRGISVTDINGKVSCSSNDNSPVLLITQEDYQKMCQNMGGQATYTYIADVNNPISVKIPNSNPYLKCQNNTPNVCIFS